MDLIDYLANFNGEFNASLGETGGYITFSNSGRRGNVKCFQISLDSLKKTIEDILNNLHVFENIQDYVEKNWRDNGSAYFTDEVANAMITVQTKPLFSTLSKLIKWGNEPILNSVDDTQKIIISQEALKNTLAKLADTILQYSPQKTKRSVPFNFPLQQIFYGAPGTGKSHKVKSEKLAGVPEENIFRTTFHPDYDYASFVGCYKPTKEKTAVAKQPILDYDTLVDKLKEYLNVANVNITKACTLFGYDYHDSIIEIQNNGKKVLDLVNDAYKSNTSYDSVVRGGMSCYESHPATNNTNSITYQFIPQVFTKAYIEAWKIIAKDEKVTVKVKKEDGTETEQEIFKPVYLVIEEINRGNCAQIFGDLFQLLDRKENGYSEYPIDIDEDLKNYLVQNLGTDSKGIKDGKLCLPPNLNLLATMNTSDQSLFPMDSAFKRRWDWEYVSIRYEKTKKEKEKNDPKDNFDTFTITIDDKHHYLWTDFLKNVNAKILSVTDSEDKQMGEYFIRKSVDEKTFINKVMYYLWSEVGKDMYGSTNPFFVQKTKNGNEQDIENQFSFNELFKENATELLIGFMKKLEVKSEEEKKKAEAAETEKE